MKMYNCPRCGYSTNQRNDLRKHFGRKINCQITLNDISISECFQTILNEECANSLKNTEKVTENSLKNTENHKNSLKNTEKRYTCIYCKKKFTRKDNMHVHVNKYCKRDQKFEINEKIKIIENLKTENEILKNSKNTTIQNNSITNNNNNNNTIIINAFGKENLSYINKEYIHSLIREGPLKIASAIFNVTHLKNL
jgi:hypothetical protein